MKISKPRLLVNLCGLALVAGAVLWSQRDDARAETRAADTKTQQGARLMLGAVQSDLLIGHPNDLAVSALTHVPRSLMEGPSLAAVSHIGLGNPSKLLDVYFTTSATVDDANIALQLAGTRLVMASRDLCAVVEVEGDSSVVEAERILRESLAVEAVLHRGAHGVDTARVALSR